MPDLQDFELTPLAAAAVTVPRFLVSFRITDSTTGATLFDFTGANALTFPNVIGALTAEQRRDWLEGAIIRLIMLRAGIE